MNWWGKCRKGPPKRVILVLMGHLAALFNYATRNNLNLAISVMVNRTAVRLMHQQPENDTSALSTLTVTPLVLNDTLDANQTTTTKLPHLKDGPFVWSSTVQTMLISSFYWGYLFTKAPGGWLCQKFGGKAVLGSCIGLSALLNFFVPLVVSWGFEWLIVLRVLLGIIQGPTYPAMSHLMGLWIPPLERSRANMIFKSGSTTGTVVVFMAGGFVISWWGWESIFYATGLVTTLFVVVWWILVHDSPKDHPHISHKESSKVLDSLGNQDVDFRKLKTPWREILTSKAVWAIMIALLGHAWGILVLSTLLPTYMRTILGFNIKAAGVLSAVPAIVDLGAGFLVSALVDWIRKKEVVGITVLRKTVNTIAFFLSGLFLLILSLITPNIKYVLLLLILTEVAGAANFSGFGPISLDIAHNFAADISGFYGTTFTLIGIIAPQVSGAILDGEPILDRWAIVFQLCTVLYWVTGVVFLIFASGKEQPWNKPDYKRNAEAAATQNGTTEATTKGEVDNPAFQMDQVRPT